MHASLFSSALAKADQQPSSTTAAAVSTAAQMCLSECMQVLQCDILLSLQRINYAYVVPPAQRVLLFCNCTAAQHNSVTPIAHDSHNRVFMCCPTASMQADCLQVASATAGLNKRTPACAETHLVSCPVCMPSAKAA
jgi:hypothetical protein